MDIELSELQRQLQVSARRFLEDRCPISLVRQLENSDPGLPHDLWSEMARLGWLGLPLPQEQGGAGLGLQDLVVLTKELGRALCPVPYIPTVVVAGGLVASAEGFSQREAILERIVAGSLIVSFAFLERGQYYDYREVEARAVPSDDGFVIDGTKRFVEFATAADMLLVAARTGDGTSAEGLSLFLVDAASPGLEFSRHHTSARDPQHRVTFRGVRVPRERLLGREGEGWRLLRPVLRRAVVASCGYMIGVAERAHALGVEYAKQRVQFGRPIGSFQAVQHYLAETITQVVAADTLTFYAAWCIDNGLPEEEVDSVVAKAKLAAGEAVKAATFNAAQVHGGLGYIEDVDITLFLRRGKQLQLSMGGPRYWSEELAASLLS